MPRVFVNQLADGSPVEEVFLLADRQLRANRHAETYLLTQLRDKTGQVSGLLWNVSESASSQFQPGDYVKVRGKAQLFQGNLQLILNRIDKVSADSVDVEDFVQETSVNTGRLLKRMREILLTIDDAPIRTLMECFLDDEQLMAQMALAPAGIRLHHAYPGGCWSILSTCWRPSSESQICIPRSTRGCSWRVCSCMTSARSANSSTTPSSATPTRDN